MKLTKDYLKKIIKEEMRKVLREQEEDDYETNKDDESYEDRFIIMKRTRARDDGDATEANAYSHPETTSRAGVEPGRIYTSRNDAEDDAKKLSRVNPVGFTVVRLA